MFCFDSRVSNMFEAGMRTTLARRLVSIVSDLCLIKHILTVWPLTSTLACFGHQTTFDGVWLPNIYRLSRP